VQENVRDFIKLHCSDWYATIFLERPPTLSTQARASLISAATVRLDELDAAARWGLSMPAIAGTTSTPTDNVAKDIVPFCFAHVVNLEGLCVQAPH
jgi:hypothetical protein